MVTKQYQNIQSTQPAPRRAKQEDREHDIGKFFSSIPTWVLLILVLIFCILAAGAGALIGEFRFHKGIEEAEGPISTSVGAILGLLAFMLGFTFSLTWGRFASRNSLVISQARSLRTCYLRTSLIPDRQKFQVRKFLREYVDLLLLLQTTPEEKLQQTLDRLDELHLLVWRQTASLAGEEMDSELRSLFTSAVNEVLDQYEERKIVALVYRIPDAIWASLLLLAGMGMFAYGYQIGIDGKSHFSQLPLLAAAFGIVVVLIADMNSIGKGGRFKVMKKPLLDLQQVMNKSVA